MNVKLPVYRAGLPGKVISFYIVSLDPAYKAGFAGHVPAKGRRENFWFLSFGFDLTLIHLRFITSCEL